MIHRKREARTTKAMSSNINGRNSVTYGSPAAV
jgi:hypothetical protein